MLHRGGLKVNAGLGGKRGRGSTVEVAFHLGSLNNQTMKRYGSSWKDVVGEGLHPFRHYREEEFVIKKVRGHKSVG